jgi:hypothetical protein
LPPAGAKAIDDALDLAIQAERELRLGGAKAIHDALDLAIQAERELRLGGAKAIDDGLDLAIQAERGLRARRYGASRYRERGGMGVCRSDFAFWA